MHAFLIINPSEDAIQTLLQKHNAKSQSAEIKTIENIRDLVKQTSLKITSKTAIIIKDFSEASIEAQNAFLKLLEEPQDNLLFILTAQNEEQIIPTIFSRVEVIRLPILVNTLGFESSVEFLSMSQGQKLTKTTKIKTREDALAFVNSLMSFAHTKLLEEKIEPKAVQAIARTYIALKQNGNVQLQLTNLVTMLS